MNSRLSDVLLVATLVLISCVDSRAQKPPNRGQGRPSKVASWQMPPVSVVFANGMIDGFYNDPINEGMSEKDWAFYTRAFTGAKS
jgi:hypothetical protein